MSAYINESEVFVVSQTVGTSASKYVLFYNTYGSYDTENLSTFEKIKDDIIRGIKPIIFINWDGCIYPAIYDTTADKFYAFVELKPGDFITITFGESIVYSSETFVNTIEIFNDISDRPASQKVIAEWVKSYVDKSIVNGAW